MTERICDGALAHVQDLLKREQEIQAAIQGWNLENVKVQYAKEQFLAFLSIEHGLAETDQIHPHTGEITRFFPKDSAISEQPSLPLEWGME